MNYCFACGLLPICICKLNVWQRLIQLPSQMCKLWYFARDILLFLRFEQSVEVFVGNSPNFIHCCFGHSMCYFDECVFLNKQLKQSVEIVDIDMRSYIIIVLVMPIN